MKITKQQYEQAGRELGVELPPWPGETEFASVPEVVVHLNDTDRHLAERFWYYTLSSRLSFEQMATVGLKLIEESTHLLSCTYGRAADSDEFEERRLELSVALSAILLAHNLLGHWVDDRHKAYRQYYRETDQVQLETVQALFFLPWRLPEPVSDLINVLAGACELIEKQLGIGPVGLDESFTVWINYPSEQHKTQLFLEFRSGFSGDLFGQIARPEVGVPTIWLSADGLNPMYVGFGLVHICPVQSHLGLKPTMSRREIEEKLNTLTYTEERPQI